jgi:hypothetical protein
MSKNVLNQGPRDCRELIGIIRGVAPHHHGLLRSDSSVICSVRCVLSACGAGVGTLWSSKTMTVILESESLFMQVKAISSVNTAVQ